MDQHGISKRPEWNQDKKDHCGKECENKKHIRQRLSQPKTPAKRDAIGNRLVFMPEHQAFPVVIENEVMLTVPPELIVVVFRLQSAPEVPTEPSITNVPPEVVIRNHVAVLEAIAVTFDGSVGLNGPPPDAAAANGLPSVNSASFVVAVPPVAGRVPS